MFQRDAHFELQTRYGLSGLRGQVDLNACDKLTQFNIEKVESTILTGLNSGVLRKEQLEGKIIDFGCGRGVSTAALSLYGGDVTGVEVCADTIAQGKKLPFVPADKILNVDGIDYLRSLPAGTLDVACSFMFGPHIDGTLCRDFLDACRHALKPGGTVLLQSDIGTLSKLLHANCLGNGFVQDDVFIAIRGIEDSRRPSPLDSFDFGDEGGMDFRDAFKKLELSRFFEEVLKK